MASRFTALPLSVGESFVLETDHNGRRWVVLFDGGQTKRLGPTQNELYLSLRENCPEIENRIDIAICSHSDHDHSGGFPSFVETWTSEGNELGEFWLPALWSPALPDVLMNPDRLIARLRDGAGQAASQVVTADHLIRTSAIDRDSSSSGGSQFRSIEQILRDNAKTPLSERHLDRIVSLRPMAGIPDEKSRRTQVAFSLGLDLDVLSIIQRNLEESHALTVPMTERLALRQTEAELWADDLQTAEILQTRQTHLNSVIETAEAIQKISTVAATHEIPIRWFDFTPFEGGETPSGGIAGFLHPLNTVEMSGVQREDNNLKLFFSLKLTEQNVSSLVFQRVEESSEPSVIFVADSRLAFGVDRPEKDFPKYIEDPKNPIIFTAAHHASRNNDRAYEVLKEWLGDDLFQKSFSARNGGVHNQTLAGYLELENRRCAQCYQCHGGEWSQLVRVETSKGLWQWPPDQGGKCGKPKKKA